MKIIETDYNYIPVPKDATSLGALPGRGWSVPIAFPTPVRINGNIVAYFNLSEYGAIRFSEAKDGEYGYLPEDAHLPSSIYETDNGYMLVPWGELQRLKTCGVDVKMWQTGSIICINYKTKSTSDGRIFLYQVQFDVTKPNQITVHYYHCVSGYNTFVGAVLETDDYVDWDIKPNTPYMKKALRFFIPGKSQIKPITPEPPQKPMGPPSHMPGVPTSPVTTEGWRPATDWNMFCQLRSEYELQYRKKG